MIWSTLFAGRSHTYVSSDRYPQMDETGIQIRPLYVGFRYRIPSGEMSIWQGKETPRFYGHHKDGWGATRGTALRKAKRHARLFNARQKRAWERKHQSWKRAQ